MGTELTMSKAVILQNDTSQAAFRATLNDDSDSETQIQTWHAVTSTAIAPAHTLTGRPHGTPHVVVAAA